MRKYAHWTGQGKLCAFKSPQFKKGHYRKIKVSQIKANLQDIEYGQFKIQTGLIMRDSIVTSKMLLNSEVWHSVTKSQLEELEIVDKILLRHILNAHAKTGLEWIYADTGKLNL